MADPYDVAFAQRSLCLCMLAHIGILVAVAVAPPEVAPVVGFAGVLVVLLTVIFAISLGTRVYHPVIGLLLGLLSVLPIMSLLIFLALSQRATRTLKEQGVRVGLLGGDLDDARRASRERSEPDPAGLG